jgi:hypothetical protein
MVKENDRDGRWITDRKRAVYSEADWADLLSDRHEGWRALILILQVIAYAIAFMAGGSALFHPELAYHVQVGVIGAVALALGIGLTLGVHQRSEPRHTTIHGKRPKSPKR